MRIFLPVLAALMVTAMSVPADAARPVKGVVQGTATAGKGVVKGTAQAGKGVARGVGTAGRGVGRGFLCIVSLGHRC